MTLIGCRCRGGNIYSRAILITQTLSRSASSGKKRNEIETRHLGILRKAFLRGMLESLLPMFFFTLYVNGYRKPKDKEIKVVIAWGFHLFPFRTEKLNLTTPMVLRKWESRSPPPSEALTQMSRGFFLLRGSVCIRTLSRLRRTLPAPGRELLYSCKLLNLTVIMWLRHVLRTHMRHSQ